MRVSVESVGLVAPGLNGWQAAMHVLRGDALLEHIALPAFKPELLPVNERRRTTSLIKLALMVIEDALAQSHYQMNELATVFASSEGDVEIVDRICTALTLPDHPVSPTHFHNSVHNAPAGYWAIAAGARHFSTSLAAGTDTFIAGLLEAASVSSLEQMPVLFVAYDYPLPPALAGRGYVDAVFATAMIIKPANSNDMNLFSLSLKSGTVEPPYLVAQLAELRKQNPAAAALPLLCALAGKTTGTLAFPYHADLSLHIEVE